ncbi:MAG TPA: hypothetical protein VFP95_03470, partial [Gammaproteobacteria bacterium]|nr:hypothetical protein [Gammaproteobacteria bacterium]
MFKYAVIVLLALPYIFASPSNAALDPRTRNEDISNTEVVANVKQSNGVYIYEYIVKSSSDNLGEIQSFEVDISCPVVVPYDDFNPSDYQGNGPNSSQNGKHVPVAVLADYGAAFLWGVTANNNVSWGLAAKSGEIRGKLTIISPYSSTSRGYRLVPFMDNSKKWNYAAYDENDPTVPWIDDFTVYGTTIGPACPGEEQKEPRFMGTRMPDEMDADNALLTYSKPLDDHIDYQVGVGQIAITIH